MVKETCPKCRGRKNTLIGNCDVCNGKGKVIIDNKLEICPFCKGKGKLYQSCRFCGGYGWVKPKKESARYTKRRRY